MDVLKNAMKARRYGTIDFREVHREDGRSAEATGATVGEFILTWRPPYRIACRIQETLIPAIECSVDKGGMRRFVPTEPAKVFAYKASLFGHAVLSDLGKVDRPGEDFTFHEARLYSQFAQHMREYLGKRSRLSDQLALPRAARPDAGTSDILPGDLGLTWRGEGEPWTIGWLKNEGLASAKAAGIDNPTPDEILWYGLYEAARMSPLMIADREVECLVQRALFAIQPEHAKVVPDALPYVKRHVRAFLKDHVYDTTEEFDRCCIEDPKANLYHRISKRKDCPWKHSERGVIRAAMLELGWQSLKMLGQSIDMFARTFAAALPQPLTRSERHLFRRTYQAHRAFGRLPLPLLYDRFDCLHPAVLAMWNDPADGTAVGVLRRLFYWYSEVAENRRAGDRRYKARSEGRNREGDVAFDLPFCDDRDGEEQDEG